MNRKRFIRDRFGSNCFRNRSRCAVTLIELLMVMTIMAVVLAFVVQGIGGILAKVNLSNSGSMVIDELNFARQEAITRNQKVEVRFYQNSTSKDYDTVVSLLNVNGANSAVQWLEKPNVVPANVMFDSSESFSSLIAATNGSSPSAGNSLASDPVTLRGRAYVCFHFRPDGSTDLDSSALTAQPPAWCLTLRNKRGAAGMNGAPAANFVTVLLDPALGSTRIYQPR